MGLGQKAELDVMESAGLFQNKAARDVEAGWLQTAEAHVASAAPFWKPIKQPLSLLLPRHARERVCKRDDEDVQRTLEDGGGDNWPNEASGIPRLGVVLANSESGHVWKMGDEGSEVNGGRGLDGDEVGSELDNGGEDDFVGANVLWVVPRAPNEFDRIQAQVDDVWHGRKDEGQRAEV